MKKELDEALCARYPLIFRDRHGDMRKTAMCWGFEVGDGWADLLDTTCAMIYAPYLQATRRYKYARENEGTSPYLGADVITAVDVERERLKMAEAAENIPVATQIKEKYGGLRFYYDGGTPEVAAYIDFAEFHSERICDVCGAPGKPRGNGWIRTVCDQHV
jgi:hypothetical protein